MNPIDKLKEHIKKGEAKKACSLVVQLIQLGRDEEDLLDIILSCK